MFHLLVDRCRSGVLPHIRPLVPRHGIVVRDENGNEVARKKVVIGANGSSGYCNFPLPGLKKGYTIEVWEKLDSNHTTQRWKKKIG